MTVFHLQSDLPPGLSADLKLQSPYGTARLVPAPTIPEKYFSSVSSPQNHSVLTKPIIHTQYQIVLDLQDFRGKPISFFMRYFVVTNYKCMDTLLTDTPSTGGYDFAMNENQQMVGQMAKDFAERYIKPHDQG